MAKETTAKKVVSLSLPALPDSLVDYSGEAVRVPRLEVPLIRVSYKSEDDDTKVAPKGEFIEYDPVTKESKPLGKKIDIQILHHRQSLSAYKNEESYWTPEISMREKETSLFLGSSNNGKRSNQFLLKGTIAKGGALRSAYPDLRYQRNMYVLHEGVLKSLVIYGASFSGFIDLTKALKGQSSSSVLLELSTKKEKTGTVIYYPITFTVKEQLNVKDYEQVQKELSDWFGRHDSLISQQLKERADQAAMDRGDEPAYTSAKPKVDLPPARKPKPEVEQEPLTVAEQIKDSEEEEIKETDLPF